MTRPSIKTSVLALGVLLAAAVQSGVLRGVLQDPTVAPCDPTTSVVAAVPARDTFAVDTVAGRVTFSRDAAFTIDSTAPFWTHLHVDSGASLQLRAFCIDTTRIHRAAVSP